MAPRVFLHIGAPKSGTTYLQSLLWSNRSLLQDRGLTVPGRQRFDHNRASIEVRAGRQLRGEAVVWDRFVRRARRGDADLMLSNEWYVAVTAEQAAGIVAELGAERVHVVFTARDLVAQVPAGWQEQIKIGTGLPLETFIAGLDDPRNKWNWAVLDPSAALRVWRELVPADQIHVVTVPRSGGDPALLWTRFLGVAGIDAAGTETDIARRNESLGVESARLLQEIGPRLLEATDPADSAWSVRHAWLRKRVAHQILVPLKGRPIGLREETVTELRERSRRSLDEVRAAGFDLVGAAEDLLEGAAKPGSLHPDDVDPAALLAPAGVLSAALLRMAREGAGETEAQASDEPAEERFPEPVGAPADDAAD